ncbi:hypothetical protein [Streptomyces sp. NPDC050504]|uniref:hypothetical protein n=1 Tax=Streptomyces sp. NPDC050504 TaxID=3365618 RepID=UPI0037A81397
MVTARSPFGTPGARRPAGAARVLWLGALLLTLLFAHGMGVEGQSGHVSPVAVTSSVLAADAHTHADPGATTPDHGTHDAPGDGDDHPGGECLSAQPQDPTPVVTAPPCAGPGTGWDTLAAYGSDAPGRAAPRPDGGTADADDSADAQGRAANLRV